MLSLAAAWSVDAGAQSTEPPTASFETNEGEEPPADPAQATPKEDGAAPRDPVDAKPEAETAERTEAARAEPPADEERLTPTASPAPADPPASAEPPASSEPPASPEPPAARESQAEPEESAAPAADRSAAPRSPARRGNGFYLRMDGGLGRVWASTSDSEASLTGWTGNFAAHVGYSFAPGIAIHGDLATSSTFATESTFDEAGDREITREGALLRMYTLGLGTSYHIMPIDIFIGAGVGVAFAEATRFDLLRDDDSAAVITQTAETDPGIAVHGSAGKLFAVSEVWSLGFSLNYAYRNYGQKDEEALELDASHTAWLGFAATFAP